MWYSYEMIVFIDAEFTDFVDAELLSLGAVTVDGRELYVELDMSTDVGQARLKVASDFVRYDGVLDLFGLVPGASATYTEVGLRTGEWLLGLAGESGSPVVVAFDYQTDFDLMQRALKDARLWNRVRDIVTPLDIRPLIGTDETESAADACLREMEQRGLARHHALADAHALRAVYLAAGGRLPSTAARVAALADAAKHSADRACAAVDDALEAVEASNKRIAAMEDQAKRKDRR